jgi:hypothetical protein
MVTGREGTLVRTALQSWPYQQSLLRRAEKPLKPGQWILTLILLLIRPFSGLHITIAVPDREWEEESPTKIGKPIPKHRPNSSISYLFYLTEQMDSGK